MTLEPAHFARLKEIFLTLEHLPDDQRPAYLREACAGEEDLRREAEALLSTDPATVHLLRPGGLPSFVAAMAHPPAPRPLPRSVGPYRILGVLGEGGMGVVYHARQESPIRREVALKLLRPGPDSAGIVARFDLERRTIALMDHPHIAHVLDAGTDENGNPFFVMELVRGLPVTDYCRESDLPLRRRLELFREVCLAVQHAHRKGVVHRDLKPSNILVTSVEGTHFPKVIDFGVAKALGSEPPLATLTGEGHLLGTLEYMSPEQARGGGGEVDARSDVYSLGVVLYELVSDDLPYDLRGRTLIESVRAIMEEEPRTIRAAAPAEGRIDADLQTIIRKALEKSPERRYGSAAELAEDLERFLGTQPIRARPPSRIYQMRKLVARHKAPFAVLAGTGFLLLAFAIVMAAMLRVESRERRAAQHGEQVARRTLDFMKEVMTSSLPDRSGGEVTVREMLDTARDELGRGGPVEPEVEIAARLSLAETYIGISRAEDAERELRRALGACDRATGDVALDRSLVLQDLAAALFYERGHLAEAESLAQCALEIRRARVGDDDAVSEILNNLAVYRSEGGDARGAEAVLRQSIEVSTRLHGDRFEGLELRLSNLARNLEAQGRLAESEDTWREVLALGRERGGDLALGFAAKELGTLLSSRGSYDEAESLLVQSIPLLDRAFGNDLHDGPPDARWELGVLHLRRGEWEAAEVPLREALATFERLAENGTAKPREQFVRTLCSLGAACTGEERYAEAESLYARAFALANGAEEGNDRLRVPALRGLADLRRSRGDLAQADSLLSEALALTERVAPADPVGTCWTLLELGMLRLDEKEADQAAPALRRSLAELSSCGRSDWWPALVAENETACALARARPGDPEAGRLWDASRSVLVEGRSPVDFTLRKRALAHTLAALRAGHEETRAPAYARALSSP